MCDNGFCELTRTTGETRAAGAGFMPARQQVSRQIGMTLQFELMHDGAHILVTPAREVDHDDRLLRQFGSALHGVVHGVGRFERTDDAFGFGKCVESR